MCGIAGIFDPRHALASGGLAEAADRMTATLVHRGPDDAGVWRDAAAGIALGHRRLSILDLSPEGRQPMVSSSGRYVIVFNGEIFNFRRLRAELESLGHRFRGHCDTEVMLAAIGQFGLEEALRRFVGMFAFALWDRDRRALSLVRDRIGIKPLYYGWAGAILLFASELKALRAHPGFHAEIDRDSLALFLRYGYVPTPRTIYRGAFKLVAGTVFTVTADHRPEGEASPQPFWSAESVVRRGLADPFRGSDEEAVEELDTLLRDAVKLRMESDVPLGAFLSGGIDSSTVVALMQAQCARPVRTFTIGFHETAYDEAARAKAVARHLGTEHTELYVEPSDALRLIPRLPEWWDEPFADSSQLPTLLVSEMTRRHVTVALSGDGGDELFAGYDRYRWAVEIWRWLRWIPRGLRRPLGAGLRAALPARIDRFFSMMPPHLRVRLAGDKVHKLAGALDVDSVDAVNRHLLSQWKDPDRLVLGAREPHGILWDETLREWIPDVVQRMQFLDLVTYLPDDILVKVDRASMAVSLEARVPLLDHRVVEFAWRLPRSMTVRGGVRKWILRRVLRRYVPNELVERPKMGFGVPIDSWLRGPLRDWAEDLLDETRLRREGFFDPAPIRLEWTEHLSGRRNWQYPLWDVLMFQAWQQRWLARTLLDGRVQCLRESR